MYQGCILVVFTFFVCITEPYAMLVHIIHCNIRSGWLLSNGIHVINQWYGRVVVEVVQF